MPKVPFVVATLALWIASSAQAAWLPDGTRLTAFVGDVSIPAIAPDGRGGVYATWTGSLLPPVNRLTADGAQPLGWSGAGILAASGPHRALGSTNDQVVPDGSGGCYVVWVAQGEGCSISCTGEPGRIRVQRVLASGQVAPDWPAEGLIVSNDDWALPFSGLETASDGQHGILIASGMVHRIGPQASHVWSVLPSNGPSWRSLLQIAPDGNGGAFAFWADGDGQAFPSGRIFAQHISARGRAEWGPRGAALSQRYSLGRGSPSAVNTEHNAAVVSWIPTAAPGERQRVLAARVTTTTRGRWNSERVACESDRDLSDVRIAPEPDGSVVMAWRDARPEAGAFAQKMDSNGRARWRANGVPICPRAGNRQQLAIASDGEGGAFIAWGSRGDAFEVFAARIAPDGSLARGWSDSGTPLCRSPEDLTGTALLTAFESVTMVPTRRGEAIVAWDDFRPFPGVGIMADAAFAMLLRDDGPAAAVPPIVPANGVADSRARAPAAFALHGIVPNPSLSGARLRFTLPEDGEASLETFDVSGRLVAERRWLAQAGPNDEPIAQDRRLAPGVYLVRLAQSGRVASARAVILP